MVILERINYEYLFLWYLDISCGYLPEIFLSDRFEEIYKYFYNQFYQHFLRPDSKFNQYHFLTADNIYIFLENQQQ